MNEEHPTPASPTSDEIRLHIAEADSDGLGSRMGMEWLVTTPDLVSARLPVEGNTQPFGLLHGGASAVLAESVGSVLANLNAGADRFAVGIELSCSHHRSAHHGFVTALADGYEGEQYLFIPLENVDRALGTALDLDPQGQRGDINRCGVFAR